MRRDCVFKENARESGTISDVFLEREVQSVLIITHARILTMEDRTPSESVIEDGYIAVEENRIIQLGHMDSLASDIAASRTDVIVDAKGGWVLPGFIDSHSHLGLFGDSLDFEGNDGNEETDPITPQLRAIDGIHQADVCFREAYEAGISTVMTGPGSANVMGGQFALIHTYERTVERALVSEPSAQKVAFGENPKRVYGKADKAPGSRMGTASLLRDTLYSAAEYREKWNDYHQKKTEYDQAVANHDEDAPDSPDRPDFDFQLESLFSVLSGQLPLKIHAHRQDDILTAVRICNEFGLKYTLDHCTEGHLIADILSEEFRAGQAPGRGTGNGTGKGIGSRDSAASASASVSVTSGSASGSPDTSASTAPAGGRLLGVSIGPIIGDRSKPELSALTIQNAGVLHNAGLPVAIITDHPCVPQQYLPMSAALAVKGGMPVMAALASITSTAARICGISDLYGSLESGKAADLTLFSGDPFDYRSKVLLFVGGGRVRFDPEQLYASAAGETRK